MAVFHLQATAAVPAAIVGLRDRLELSTAGRVSRGRHRCELCAVRRSWPGLRPTCQSVRPRLSTDPQQFRRQHRRSPSNNALQLTRPLRPARCPRKGAAWTTRLNGREPAGTGAATTDHWIPKIYAAGLHPSIGGPTAGRRKAAGTRGDSTIRYPRPDPTPIKGAGADVQLLRDDHGRGW